MAKIRLAVLVSGGGTNLQAIIDACAAGQIEAEIALVLSSRSKAFALQRAEKAGIQTVVCSPRHYNNTQQYSRAVSAELDKQEIDLIILAGFMSIFSSEFIAKYRNRIMNTHPSLLPSFGGRGCYGKRVHQQVLDYGVKISGATIMFVSEDIDTGPIILQEAVAVAEDETLESLQQKVLRLEHKLYPQAISLFAADRLQIRGRRVHILPAKTKS